jgi:hypothetical protein
MTGLLEFGARAALCRQLARREPDSEILWLAEAERWSRLTVTPGVAAKTPQSGIADTRDVFEALLAEMSPGAAKAN